MTSMKYDVSLLDRDARFTLWQVEMRALLAQANYQDALSFSSRWSFGDYGRRDNGCNLLQLFEEHNSVIKKKKGMEEVIIKPVGSQHILYSLHSILLLCM